MSNPNQDKVIDAILTFTISQGASKYSGEELLIAVQQQVPNATWENILEAVKQMAEEKINPVPFPILKELWLHQK